MKLGLFLMCGWLLICGPILQSPETYSGLSQSTTTQDSGLLVEAEKQRLNNGFNNGVGSNGDALACLIASLAATSSPSNGSGSDATNSTASTSAWSPSHNQVSTSTTENRVIRRGLTVVNNSFTDCFFCMTLFCWKMYALNLDPSFFSFCKCKNRFYLII